MRSALTQKVNLTETEIFNVHMHLLKKTSGQLRNLGSCPTGSAQRASPPCLACALVVPDPALGQNWRPQCRRAAKPCGSKPHLLADGWDESRNPYPLQAGLQPAMVGASRPDMSSRAPKAQRPVVAPSARPSGYEVEMPTEALCS